MIRLDLDEPGQDGCRVLEPLEVLVHRGEREEAVGVVRVVFVGVPERCDRVLVPPQREELEPELPVLLRVERSEAAELGELLDGQLGLAR